MIDSVERMAWGWRLYVVADGFGKYFRVNKRTWATRGEYGGVREMGGLGGATPPKHTFLAMVKEVNSWARAKRQEHSTAIAYAQGDPPD